MKCPTDSATLIMSERSGVEIDYCPECRGVWLDRGELDKILARAEAELAALNTAAAAATAAAASAAAPPAAPAQPIIIPLQAQGAAQQQSQYPNPRYGTGQYGDREGDRRYTERDDRTRSRDYDRDRDRDDDDNRGGGLGGLLGGFGGNTNGGYGNNNGRRKKESWLSDLFD